MNHSASRGALKNKEAQATIASITSHPPLPKQFCKMRSNKICFITDEFDGLFKNGGIGTANTGLATLLAANGFDVTVVYTHCDDNGPLSRFESFDVVQDYYRKLGITINYLSASPKLLDPFSDNRRSSYAIYEYLRDKDFDAIYFNDCGGQPFYTATAKRAGSLKYNPAIYVVLHGPHEWTYEINVSSWSQRQHLIIAFMERKAVELADAVISPSRYLVNWMIDHGWKLPQNVFVEQNIVDVSHFAWPNSESAPTSAVNELVFFGRQEARKGPKLFCDAIDLISPGLLRAGVKITMMGKFSTVDGLHSGAYVLERSRRWGIPVRFLVNYRQAEGLAYLLRSRAVAVIPSLAENSPCVVAECLQLGIPFIATDTGGTAELLLKRDRAHCLVAPDPQALGRRLLHCVELGQKPGRIAIPQAITARRWQEFHAPFSLPPLAETTDEYALAVAPTQMRPAFSPHDICNPEVNNAPLAEAAPRVSVCIVHFNKPAFLNQALESVVNQTYSNYEIIIVDDGSTEPKALANLNAIEERRYSVPVTVARQHNLYLGAARNTGARNATGDYFLFLDEDDLLMPTAIEDFVRAATLMNADIVTGIAYHFYSNGKPDSKYEGEILYLPLGGCAEIGMFENCFGGATALVSRNAYEIVGGFHEDYGQAVEDWQFFATATLKGLRVEVLPKPSWWYRVRADGMFIKSNPVQNARRLINLYKTYPISVIGKIVEGLLEIGREQSYRLDHMLRVSGAAFRDLLLQISNGDVNGKSSIKGFLDYMVKRGWVSEAVDFAMNNNLDLLESVVKTAHEENKATALQEIQQRNLEIRDEVNLTEDIKLRARPVAGINPVEFIITTPGGFVHPINPNISAVKAAGVCPTGTTGIRATALQVDGGDTQALAAVVVCTSESDITLVRGDLVPNENVLWSDWVPLQNAGAPRQIGIAMATPTSGQTDMFFLTKVADGAMFRNAAVSWIDIAADVVAIDRATKSNFVLDRKAYKLPENIVRMTGKFLTPVEDLNLEWHPFTPGKPTVLHPLHDRVALVRLEGVISAGSKGARSTVSINHPKSHPIQFGMWLHDSTQPIDSVEALRTARGFSGWLTVSQHGYYHSLNVILPELAVGSMDIYIATRVVGQKDQNFCHALYHEFYALI